MNERIKELLEQAGPLQEVLSEITEQTNDKGPRYIRSMTLLDFQLKKFAELIVRECAKLIDAEESQSSYGDMLKEHFGVEE